MIDILVLYYSRNGATEALAREVCRGVDAVKGTSSRLRTVPPVSAVCESTEDAIPSGGPPYASNDDMRECAGLVMGSPTRFGNMAGQMRTFLDQTGGLWAEGKLHGKVASVFTSTGTGGGQEHTISSFWTTLAHHGMVIVPLGYGIPEFFDISEVNGGTPYGASTIAGGDGSRQPSEKELAIARFQGKHVAELAVKLHG